MMVSEPSTGNENFISFLVGQNAETYLDAFRDMTNRQVADGVVLEKLKQAGIGMVPLQGLSLVPLEDVNRYATPRVLAVIPRLNVDTGQIEIPSVQEVAVANRPHADGFLGAVSQDDFRRAVIEVGMGAR